MEQSHDTNKRLTELEIKASFTEDLLEQLEQIVIRQQAQIDSLMREVVRLRAPATTAPGDGPRDLRDELPPHY